MTSLKEVLIESMIKDLESIKNLDDPKLRRKECSLLLKRVESAKRLSLGDTEQSAKLVNVEVKILELRESLS